MSQKTPSTIAATVTILLLIILAIGSTLFEMLALNGASESQGTIAMRISLACQGVSILLIGMFAWRFTHLLIEKFNWSKILAVIVVVFAGTMLGTGISFVSIIISIPAAGIK